MSHPVEFLKHVFFSPVNVSLTGLVTEFHSHVDPDHRQVETQRGAEIWKRLCGGNQHLDTS